MSFYNFIRGVIPGLGTGVDDEGYLRSSTLPIYNGTSPLVNVQRSFGPTAMAFAKDSHALTQAYWGGAGGNLSPDLTRLAGKDS